MTKEFYLNTCNLCNYKGECKVITTQLREGEGLILECPNCKHIFQASNESNEDLEKYYNEVYTRTNSLLAEARLTTEEHFKEKIKTITNLLQHLSPYLNPDIDVLEIGAGSGALIYSIKNIVRSCYAVELNRSYVEFMNSIGIKAYYGFIENLNIDRKFDLIISINMLEHSTKPVDTLNMMYSLLNPGGILYLEVPNKNEALNYYLPENNRKKYNKFFWHKAHYSYFYEDTILKALEMSGFVDVTIKYRHIYTILNYLHWYYRGEPQRELVDASTNTKLFRGNSEFENEFNRLIDESNEKFMEIMSKTKKGDTMICVAKKQ